MQIFSKMCTKHDSSVSEWWLIFSSHLIWHKLFQLFKFDYMSSDNDRGLKQLISKEHRNEVLQVGQLHERSIWQTPVSEEKTTCARSRTRFVFLGTEAAGRAERAITWNLWFWPRDGWQETSTLIWNHRLPLCRYWAGNSTLLMLTYSVCIGSKRNI